MKLRNYAVGAIALSCVLAGSLGRVSAVADEKPGEAAKLTGLEQLDIVIPNGVTLGPIDASGKTGKELKEMINSYVQKRQERTIKLTIGDNEKEVAVSDLGYSWTNEEEVASALNHLERGSLFNRYCAFKDVTAGDLKAELKIEPDETALGEFIDGIKSEFDQDPVDARIARENGQWVTYESEQGLAIDSEGAGKLIVESLTDESWDGNDLELTLECETTEPNVDSSAFAGFGALLGTFDTGYDGAHGNPNRNNNVVLATQKMNGHWFQAGETISMNAMIAPVTADGGYLPAPGYLDGKQVDTVGGGICQVATTFYNAALNAELQVKYRKNHSFAVNYVDPSFDATISPPGLDLTMINSTGHPIYVESYIHNYRVYVAIYGVETRPANRQVKYRSVILSQDAPLPTIDTPDTSMAWGTVVYDNDCHQAMVSELYKDVYVDGVLQSSECINHDIYKPMAAVRRYGPPVDPDGNLWYVRDDGYIVAPEDKNNPNAPAYRLSNGDWLDKPWELNPKGGDDDDDDGKDTPTPTKKPDDDDGKDTPTPTKKPDGDDGKETPKPTKKPTDTPKPTKTPTKEPTQEPTQTPTKAPTETPSESSSSEPVSVPETPAPPVPGDNETPLVSE